MEEKRCNSRALCWRHIFYAVGTVCVLLPVPAFAAFDFSTLSWSLPSLFGSPFATITTTGTSSTHAILNFTTNNDFQSNGTFTITSTGTGVTLANNESLNGNWTNLNLLDIDPGTRMDIRLRATSTAPPSTNNMFTQSY